MKDLFLSPFPCAEGGFFKKGYSFGWFLEPEKQCPHKAENSPVRGEGSAVGAGQHSSAFEVCDHTLNDHPVMVEAAVQALVGLGEFSCRWVLIGVMSPSPWYPLSARTSCGL